MSLASSGVRCLVVCGVVGFASLQAAEPSLAELRSKGIAFLKNTQADDGSWTTPNSPGITGLILTSLLRSGLKPDDPTVAKALKFMESHVQPDGGVYFSKSNHRNYESCIAILAFVEANKEGQYDKVIAGAEKFLREQQWDEGEQKDKDDPNYGGAGYGSKSRPDLSNTAFLVEALHTAGVKADDPAMKKALIFVSRSQNLESEHNLTPFAAKINDGGFYYTPAAGGESFAGKEDGLRSYASMTYAGLKSMLYAGLGKDDKRVKAATEWIKKHYTVSENPGMDQNGLFYYLHTFAKTQSVLGAEEFTDAEGKKHNWRQDLIAQFAKMQKENGSWVNTAPRWGEGDPNMVTGFALLALSYCDAPAAK